MTKPPLRLCPFCGEQADYHLVDSYPYNYVSTYVTCSWCHVQTPTAGDLESVAEVWNRRSEKSQLAPLPTTTGDS